MQQQISNFPTNENDDGGIIIYRILCFVVVFNVPFFNVELSVLDVIIKIENVIVIDVNKKNTQSMSVHVYYNI